LQNRLLETSTMPSVGRSRCTRSCIPLTDPLEDPRHWWTPTTPKYIRATLRPLFLASSPFEAATTPSATPDILIGGMAGASVILVSFRCTRTLARGGTLGAQRAGSDLIVGAVAWTGLSEWALCLECP